MVLPYTCYAEAFPKARYYWNFEEGNFTSIGPTLSFRHGIRRYQVGVLTKHVSGLDRAHLKVFKKFQTRKQLSKHSFSCKSMKLD